METKRKKTIGKENISVKDISGSNSIENRRVLSVTCPKCHKHVEFVLSRGDRELSEDGKIYKDKALELYLEKVRLNEVIVKLVSK